MVLVGLVVLAVAVVGALIFISGNTGTVQVHVLGGVWSVRLYWVLVAGMALVALAVAGLWLVRAATGRAWRLRREGRGLVAENRRLRRSAAGTGTATDVASMPAAKDQTSYPDSSPR